MRRAVAISRMEESTGQALNGAANGRGNSSPRAQVLSSMFNFSANHLLLLSRMEYRTCAVLLMRDDSTHRVYRLHDFTKSQTPTPGQYYCVSGKVNSADKLYLVIESIKPDTKHGRCSTVPAHADGAGGRSIV
jgi:hypothetical protein